MSITQQFVKELKTEDYALLAAENKELKKIVAVLTER